MATSPYRFEPREHEGLLEADARDMIEGVFELDDSVVGKVMTPRSKVDFIRFQGFSIA